jgi:hypothetical protein
VSPRILLTMTFVLAISTQTSAAARTSGLYGKVLIEPGMPVCRMDMPCSRPAKDFKLAFVRNGRIVATVKTDEHGRYRIGLPAGRYAVRPRVQGGPRQALEPTRVTVPRGRFAKRDFTLDIGIR